MAQSQNIIEI